MGLKCQVSVNGVAGENEMLARVRRFVLHRLRPQLGISATTALRSLSPSSPLLPPQASPPLTHSYFVTFRSASPLLGYLGVSTLFLAQWVPLVKASRDRWPAWLFVSCSTRGFQSFASRVLGSGSGGEENMTYSFDGWWRN